MATIAKMDIRFIHIEETLSTIQFQNLSFPWTENSQAREKEKIVMSGILPEENQHRAGCIHVSTDHPVCVASPAIAYGRKNIRFGHSPAFADAPSQNKRCSPVFIAAVAAAAVAAAAPRSGGNRWCNAPPSTILILFFLFNSQRALSKFSPL